MSYSPSFTITPGLLARVERISALRERILSSSVEVAWIPSLQVETRARNAHSSTAIEGNPLTLEEVRAIEEGRELPAAADHARREVLNYVAGLRYVEKHAGKKSVLHKDILALHRIVGDRVMHLGDVGRYRDVRVRVGGHLPPAPEQVHDLMTDLLAWWNKETTRLSPVMSSAIVHYQFEHIHPFADGNGRTGRALALWELYRRGFDTHHIFSVDEFYWEDRSRYYEELEAVRHRDGDLTDWLEYCAEGLEFTLQRVWKRIGKFALRAESPKLHLRPRQELLLQLLRDRGPLAPREIWDALDISRQGAMDLLRPLLEAGFVLREGTHKSGRYRIAKP